MPSIPRFSLTQDETTVTVTINVPFIRVANAESLIDGKGFTFSCSPYLLRLTFPGDLVDSEEFPAKGSYDPNVMNGTLTVVIRKMVEGMFFEDLDLTTKLLQERHLPKAMMERGVNGPPVIEVVGGGENEICCGESDEDGEDLEEEEDNDEGETI